MSVRGGATLAVAPAQAGRARQGNEAWTLSSLGLGKLVLGPPNGVAPTAPVPTAAPKKKARAEQPRPFWMDPDNHWDSDTSDEEKPLSLRPAAAKTVRRQQEAAAAGATPVLTIDNGLSVRREAGPIPKLEKDAADEAAGHDGLAEFLDHMPWELTQDYQVMATPEALARVEALYKDVPLPIDTDSGEVYDDDDINGEQLIRYRRAAIFWLMHNENSKVVVQFPCTWYGIAFDIVFVEWRLAPSKAAELLAARAEWNTNAGLREVDESGTADIYAPIFGARPRLPADRAAIKAATGSDTITSGSKFSDALAALLRNHPETVDEMKRLGDWSSGKADRSLTSHENRRWLGGNPFPDDHIFEIGAIRALWEKQTYEIRNMLAPGVHGNDNRGLRPALERMAADVHAKPNIAATPQRMQLFGVIPVTFKANLSWSKAKQTLRVLDDKGRTKRWGFECSRTMVVTDRSNPAHAAIGAALRAMGYPVPEGSAGSVDPDRKDRGDPVMPALRAAFKSLPLKLQKRLAHPYRWGPSFPIQFAVDDKYRDLYDGREEDPAALEAYLAKCERETGLPRQ